MLPGISRLTDAAIRLLLQEIAIRRLDRS